jgi:hypothetical protein
MAKLKLDMADLAVQSFATDDLARVRGTVRAHDTWGAECGTGGSYCQCIPSWWDWRCGTYDPGCGGTDWQTCANTCNTCDEYTCISCDTCQITGACKC